MPQKTIFLTEKMIETINKLAKEKGEKFSSMCNALIEQGLKNSAWFKLTEQSAATLAVF